MKMMKVSPASLKWALGFTAVAASVLLGCGGGSSSTGSDTTTGGGTGSNPDATEVVACASSVGHARLVCLADEFKKLLTADQLAAVQRSYTVAEAKKWSNLPQSLVQTASKRVGLNLGSMTSAQIQVGKALIKAAAGSASNEGWDEIQQIINADEYLSANGGGGIYGATNYYIAFLGTPSATGTWELQFGGHHLAFANTYKDGVLVGATPAFRSAEPFDTFTWNGIQNQPVQQERLALSNMLTAFSDAELTGARLATTFTDLLVGPQKDGQFPATPSGLKVGTLSADKKALVLAAIRTYVQDISSADADVILQRYAAELDNTYVSFSGTTGMLTLNDYVRIDGPSVWIEYSTQHGIVLQPTHPHTVWRDKTTDYGGNT